MKKLIPTLSLILSTAALSANAMEPICDQAARIAGAAFKEAGSLGYEQQQVDSFQSFITPGMSLIRTGFEKLGENKYLETYLVQEEVASGVINLATVVIEAYNTSSGICDLKSISKPRD